MRQSLRSINVFWLVYLFIYLTTDRRIVCRMPSHIFHEVFSCFMSRVARKLVLARKGSDKSVHLHSQVRVFAFHLRFFGPSAFHNVNIIAAFIRNMRKNTLISVLTDWKQVFSKRDLHHTTECEIKSKNQNDFAIFQGRENNKRSRRTCIAPLACTHMIFKQDISGYIKSPPTNLFVNVGAGVMTKFLK